MDGPCTAHPCAQCSELSFQGRSQYLMHVLSTCVCTCTGTWEGPGILSRDIRWRMAVDLSPCSLCSVLGSHAVDHALCHTLSWRLMPAQPGNQTQLLTSYNLQKTQKGSH